MPQISARDWQSLPQFSKLPTLAYTCAKAGWYQGSAFFLMTGLFYPLIILYHPGRHPN